MIVEPQHFKYLALQHGGISDFRDDFIVWKQNYERTLQADFDSIKPALPAFARSVLDVGGGCSGIGAKINEHFCGRMLVAVLDGKNGEVREKVGRHNRPYNNATITQHFLRVNGVNDQLFFTPTDEIKLHFDIIISTQAWCFHFPPDEYLSQLEFCVKPGSRVILDVRRKHPEWLEELDDAFGEHRVLLEREKWTRCAWTIR